MSQDVIFFLITQEEERQRHKIGLIPSENVVSPEVGSVLSSCLSNKYSEGYPGRRYYEGNQFIDEIEVLAQERVKKLFGVPYVNVQPYSGSPANLAIYFALMKPGETLMGLKLAMGGHLTHGHPKVTASGTFYNSVQYGVRDDARIDFEQVRALAHEHKPKVIVAGNTAYPFELDFKQFREIADEVGAWLVADISHVTGLVVAGVHTSPVPYADVVMTTTHKTFRGPRGAMIMVTPRGLEKDPKLGSKIDSAIIPGLQGGPHNATTAGIAVAALEAQSPAFVQYGKRVVENAKALAEALKLEGIELVGGGTETHLMVLDFTKLGAGLGKQIAVALDVAGIYANANTVPNEPSSPFFPSGVRIGTPLVTTRGMGVAEMKKIAHWIAQVVEVAKVYQLPEDKKARAAFIANLSQELAKNSVLQKIEQEVRELTRNYPLFSW